MSRHEFTSDKAILQKITQHLARMGAGSQCRVNAVIHNGQVTLTGNLQYETQRRQVLRAANSVEGVHGVLDQLKVAAQKPWGQ